MRPINEQRCANHANREAAARCLECGRFFCRECVTEHESRLLCVSCLRKLTKRSVVSRLHLGYVWRVLHVLFSLILLWSFFTLMGKALLSMPSAFHEGTLWESKWWEE